MTNPTEGMMLTSSLRLCRRLGEGGMGSVWIAEHLGLNSRVVVKFMARELASDAEAIARFSREAAVAAQVRSPHVVQVFDHGVEGGQPYIVMELLEGIDLAHHLDVLGRMPAAEVSTLVAHLANALSRAHKMGVVHRDIKPGNVFLTDDDDGALFAKLLDFGIARTTEKLSRVTRTGVIFGTPQYMAPEALLHPDVVSPSVDLWALAAVAYEALTGERAFDGETIAAVTLKVHAVERPKPSSLVADCPPALDAWFERAFSLDPAARFTDARSMADAFQEAQASAPMRPSVPHAPRRAPQGGTLPMGVGTLSYEARRMPTLAAFSRETVPVATPEPVEVSAKDDVAKERRRRVAPFAAVAVMIAIVPFLWLRARTPEVQRAPSPATKPIAVESNSVAAPIASPSAPLPATTASAPLVVASSAGKITKPTASAPSTPPPPPPKSASTLRAPKVFDDVE